MDGNEEYHGSSEYIQGEHIELDEDDEAALSGAWAKVAAEMGIPVVGLPGVNTEVMEAIRRAARAIQEADALLITAGAGMGVDSGLPDFRGNEGFWNAYPPMRKHRISFSQMANPRWFRDDPQLAWGFYGHRLHLYRNTRPHQGFQILLDWCRKRSLGYWVLTSNVDGQFQVAGFDPSRVVEVHGSIHHLQCSRPCCKEIWSADDIEVKVDEETFKAGYPLPRCPHCRQLARPNILMFGDSGWISARTDEQEAQYQNWLQELSGHKLVVIECGAGKAVATVRRISEALQKYAGARLVRINRWDVDGPPGTISIGLADAGADHDKFGRLTKLGALDALRLIEDQITLGDG